MDHVTEGLWIASIDSVRSEYTADFDRVISVCQDTATANVRAAIEYDHYELAPNKDAVDDYGGRCSFELFEAAAYGVMDAMQDDEKVVVHCHMGQNRSAAVCMAAVGVYHSINMEDAYQMVENARPRISIEPTMMQYAIWFIGSHGT